jgi:hypothetical protein
MDEPTCMDEPACAFAHTAHSSSSSSTEDSMGSLLLDVGEVRHRCIGGAHAHVSTRTHAANRPPANRFKWRHYQHQLESSQVQH